jgi:hypothetical protein
MKKIGLECQFKYADSRYALSQKLGLKDFQVQNPDSLSGSISAALNSNLSCGLSYSHKLDESKRKTNFDGAINWRKDGTIITTKTYV